jgi:hypothetical protein
VGAKRWQDVPAIQPFLGRPSLLEWNGVKSYSSLASTERLKSGWKGTRIQPAEQV